MDGNHVFHTCLNPSPTDWNHPPGSHVALDRPVQSVIAHFNIGLARLNVELRADKLASSCGIATSIGQTA